MSTMAGVRGSGEQRPPFSRRDIQRLQDALAGIYNSRQRAERFLREVGFPRALVPGWPAEATPADYWNLVFEELDRGVMSNPYPEFLAFARATYGAQDELLDLHTRYGEPRPEPREPPPQPATAGHLQQTPADPQQQPAGPPPADTCRVVAWLDSPEQRADLHAWLASHGLDPELAWSTSTSVSYRVNQADADAVTDVMQDRRDLQWTVVAAGTPDYVLRHLSVQGPDGRSFRFNDVPSATTFGAVAGELVDPVRGGRRPARRRPPHSRRARRPGGAATG